jgi:hypothetical protein
MPFYLYGTRQEMHIDHVLVQAPNAQISAGEVSVELIEGSESALVDELRNGLIVVADAIPERLMQPFTSDRLKRLFYPGAKIDVSVYLDQMAAQSQVPGFCDNLGDPIARATITLGSNTFVDEYMINVDAVVVMSQAPKKSMTIPETTSASHDHPLFRGYALEGPIERSTSTTGSHSWREVWDRALAGRQFEDAHSSVVSNGSTASDTETEDDYSSSESLSSSRNVLPELASLVFRFASGSRPSK